MKKFVFNQNTLCMFLSAFAFATLIIVLVVQNQFFFEKDLLLEGLSSLQQTTQQNSNKAQLNLLSKSLDIIKCALIKQPYHKESSGKHNFSWQAVLFDPSYQVFMNALKKRSTKNAQEDLIIEKILVQVDAIADEFDRPDEPYFNADIRHLAYFWKNSMHQTVIDTEQSSVITKPVEVHVPKNASDNQPKLSQKISPEACQQPLALPSTTIPNNNAYTSGASDVEPSYYYDYPLPDYPVLSDTDLYDSEQLGNAHALPEKSLESRKHAKQAVRKNIATERNDDDNDGIFMKNPTNSSTKKSSGGDDDFSDFSIDDNIEGFKGTLSAAERKALRELIQYEIDLTRQVTDAARENMPKQCEKNVITQLQNLSV